MSNMLEQAIVDAKALKEAAFKSAQDALLEKYAPEIKEAVSTMLEQDEEEDMSLFDAGGMEPDMGQGEVSGLADSIPLAATDGEKLCACPDEEEEIEIDFDALEKQMRAEEEAETMGHEELADEVGMGPGDDLELDEVDLYEMLGSELELDEAESCGSRDEEDVMEEVELEEETIEESEPLQESLQTQKKEIIKAVLSETKKIEGKLLKENKKLLSEKKELIKENKDLKSSIESIKGKVEELSETLQGVNLNNAKLLYTNQVLKSASLNERQKTKIVEAISRAGSVDEAKTIYETLIDSVGSSSENRRPESLNEVVGGKRTSFVKRHSTRAVSPEKDRWQALAGIKK